MCSFEEQKESGCAFELCLNSTLQCMPSFFQRQTALTPFVIRGRIRCWSNCAALRRGSVNLLCPLVAEGGTSLTPSGRWYNLKAFLLLEILSSSYKLFRSLVLLDLFFHAHLDTLDTPDAFCAFSSCTSRSFCPWFYRTTGSAHLWSVKCQNHF